MKAPLFDIKGKQTGTVDLEATHFGVTPNAGLIHRLLILQQANGRIAIAHAKHRGEVAGSTRKMFKQKGTGNARMGDRRSPMRRGGGAVFGPRSEQNWAVSMNKQERRLALFSLLSTKAASESIKVVETFV
jgi:large subunit ribosomal protein L4